MTLDKRNAVHLGLALFVIQAVGSTAILMAAREDFGGPDIYKALFYVFTVMLLCAIALNQSLMRKVLGWWSLVGVLSCLVALFAGVADYPLTLILFSAICWGLAAWLLLIKGAGDGAGRRERG